MKVMEYAMYSGGILTGDLEIRPVLAASNPATAGWERPTGLAIILRNV